MAKILLGLTAFICLWLTAYRVWKPEHNKVVERDQRKHQPLDEISALRQTMVGYRIDMEADVKAIRFDPKAWQQKYDALEEQIAAKIEQLSSKAEAITFRNRGNIPRAINTDLNRGSGFLWPVLVDTCIPFWDSWSLLISGRDITWSWLISLHNEHRPLLPRLVLIADYWLSEETNVVDFVVGFTMLASLHFEQPLIESTFPFFLRNSGGSLWLQRV
jgi:hypothetical protein